MILVLTMNLLVFQSGWRGGSRIYRAVGQGWDEDDSLASSRELGGRGLFVEMPAWASPMCHGSKETRCEIRQVRYGRTEAGQEKGCGV